MPKKKVLIFLDKLRNEFSGLGQVAMCYGLELVNQMPENIEFTYVVPKRFKGFFGDKVNYITYTWVNRLKIKFSRTFDYIHYLDQDMKLSEKNNHIPYLVTVHDLNYFFTKSDRKIKRYHTAMIKKLKHAKALICVSQFTANMIKKHIPVDKNIIHSIPVGIKNFTAIKEEKPKNFPPISNFVLAVAELRKYKNFSKLIDIFSYIPHYTLVLVGKGSKKSIQEMQEKIVQLQLTDRVFYLGTCHQNELAWLYNNCTLYTSISKAEGFNAPIIEAMSVGKPAMLSKDTCHTETGSHFALYWDNTEPKAMAEEFQSKMKDLPLLLNKKKEIQQYAHSFTWKKHVSEMIKIYNSLLEERQSN